MDTRIFGRFQIILFLTLVGMGVIAALVVDNLLVTSTQEVVSGEAVEVNQPIPDVKIAKYESKSIFDLSAVKGKALLIYIKTSCKGCQTEAEILSKSSLLKGSGVKVYAIADENGESVRNFSEKYHFNFPVFRDINGNFREKLKIRYFPTNLILNNGKIEKRWIGSPKNIEDFHKKMQLN